MSVLGRDIAGLFAVIVDSPVHRVCLAGQRPRYSIMGGQPRLPDRTTGGTMSHSVRRTPDGRWELVLQDEPAHCRALPMAPSEMEPELREGLWLILVAAVWSGPDRNAIGAALSTVRKFEGRVRLGIRLFDDSEETNAWFPDVPKQAASPLWLQIFRDDEDEQGLLARPTRYEVGPLWLLMQDGVVLEVTVGGQTPRQIREMLQRATR